jgi:hypothetical protein
MMVSGKLSISSAQPLEVPRHSSIDRETLYVIVALLILYAPGITLLVFAVLYKGRAKSDATPTV